MSKSNSVVAMIPSVLEVGTVVVHNYGEFTHGTVVKHINQGMYEVFFPVENCPNTDKYKNNIKSRVRTLRLNAGFFVSRFDSLEAVKKAQAKYKVSGTLLETV